MNIEEYSKISKEEKWNAVISCDKYYDGLFYYAVKTTGIFCRPSCRAKSPLKENILFFSKPEDAMEKGFRPCKLCRPDIKGHDYEPNKELVQRVRDRLSKSYNKAINLKAISQEFGVSTSHLMRLFKEYCGQTPNEYIKQIRINEAIHLLRKSDLDILVIAYDVGFKSLSSFYKCFKEKTGCTPNAYRKRTRVKDDGLT